MKAPTVRRVFKDTTHWDLSEGSSLAQNPKTKSASESVCSNNMLRPKLGHTSPEAKPRCTTSSSPRCSPVSAPQPKSRGPSSLCAGLPPGASET